jgi:hypothetical protein
MDPEWEFSKEGWEQGGDWHVRPGVVEIRVMNGSGDLRKIWNAANADEVEDARRSFEHLVKKKKYLAFKVDPKDNTKGEQIREFDPDAGKMILMPPMAGG